MGMAREALCTEEVLIPAVAYCRLLFIELSNNFVTTIGPGALNSGSDFLCVAYHVSAVTGRNLTLSRSRSIQLANNLIDTVESEMFREFRGESACVVARAPVLWSYVSDA